MAVPQNVFGFTVLQIKYTEKSKAGHYIYIKEHAVRESDPGKPSDKTLFILNIPPYCDKYCLKRMFSKCGKISAVYIHDKPTSKVPRDMASKFFKQEALSEGFKVVYIVFTSPASLKKAKNLSADVPLIMSAADKPLHTGVRKWSEQYASDSVDVDALQKEIDEYMKSYDARVEKETKKTKEMEGVEDEDGWITVTRVGKKKGAPHTEEQKRKVTFKERKKRKEKELLNFYSFQIRETKRENIANLRKKFEEDKQRIALMKESRKFRPY